MVHAKQVAGRRTADWLLPATPTRLRLRRLALRAAGPPGMNRFMRASLLAGAGRIP